MQIPPNFRLLYPKDAIQQRVGVLAASVTQWLNGGSNDPQSLALCVLRGGSHFFSDLVREIPVTCEPGFCRAISYGTSSNTQLEAGIKLDIYDVDVAKRRILVIDEICDTGKTLERIVDELLSRGAQEVRTAVMIYRDHPASTFHPDWAAFTTNSSAWFVGYGMADRERYSNLPEIYEILR